MSPLPCRPTTLADCPNGIPAGRLARTQLVLHACTNKPMHTAPANMHTSSFGKPPCTAGQTCRPFLPLLSPPLAHLQRIPFIGTTNTNWNRTAYLCCLPGGCIRCLPPSLPEALCPRILLLPLPLFMPTPTRPSAFMPHTYLQGCKQHALHQVWGKAQLAKLRVRLEKRKASTGALV